MQFAILVFPFHLLYQAAWRCLSGHPIQHLIGWVTVYQTIKTIRITCPNMQLVVLLIYNRVLSELLR
jgi:hypothetical protein